MTQETKTHIDWFRDSAPYINSNRGKTFVLMLGGDALAHPRVETTIHDIALLSSLGVRLVMVFGARQQIEARVNQRNITSRFHNNLRVTDEATLECVKDAVGALRTEIESLLSMGLANSPMHNARLRVTSGNYVIAKPLGILDGVDLCHTGEVRRIDCAAIRRQLDAADIVLLPPLGYSPTGEIFNLSAEQLASQAAVSLRADKLIFMCGSAGAIDEQGNLLRELNTHEAQTLVAAGEQTSQVARHLQAAAEACSAGVPRAHLVDFGQNGALLSELYTRDGSGTLVTIKGYEHIRPALVSDVGGIIQLIQPLEEQGILVRRSRELLEAEIERFTVIERDGAIVGCAALYPFQAEPVAELACVAVHPDYRRSGRGEQLVESICSQARRAGIERIVVLSTQTAHWFLELGFIRQSLESLPAGRQSLYNWQRNSSVFERRLA